MSDTGSQKQQHSSPEIEDVWQENERGFQAVWRMPPMRWLSLRPMGR